MRQDIESVRREVARKAPLGEFYALGFSRWVVTWKFIDLALPSPYSHHRMFAIFAPSRIVISNTCGSCEMRLGARLTFWQGQGSMTYTRVS